MASFDVMMLAEPADRAVRLVALALLDDATAARDRLVAGGDVEALHDFRVAVRRLRSWFRAQKGVLDGTITRKSLNRLRDVAAATNASRDTEVFLEWLTAQREHLTPRQRHGLDWLTARLTKAKQKADTGAQETIWDDFERVRRSLTRRLETYHALVHLHEPLPPRSLAAITGKLLAAHVEALRVRLGAVESIEDQTRVHEGRIAGKRLRYLLEPVAAHVDGGADAIKSLKSLQDTLGDLHDAQVWNAVVTEALEEVATDEARRQVRAAKAPSPAGLTAGAAATAATTAIAARAARRAQQRNPRSGLIAIAALVRTHGEAAFASLQGEWLGRAGDPFLERVEGIAHALTARGNAGFEIERKYLLARLPDELPASEVREIDQGYLPGERLVERLRRAKTGDRERFFRTVKVGNGVMRIELEEEASRPLFESMWPLTEGRRLCKRRHVVPDGELQWEIDEFTDRDLVLAEIELPSPEHDVPFPDWLASVVVREVTDEAEYINANLAR